VVIELLVWLLICCVLIELIFGDILIIACIFCLQVDGSITGDLKGGGGGAGVIIGCYSM